MNIVIRRATEKDKDFVIRAILESEKSGSDIISYCAIFNINENTFKEILSKILDENIEGQELCLSNFLIADVDGENAATISAWIENEEGMASNVIKSNLLMYFMDRATLLNAAPNISLMNEVNITRDIRALQIECVFTEEKFRGNGLVKQLIKEHILQKQNAKADFDKAQIILLKNNASAIRSYEKAGFTIAAENHCSNPAIFKLLPSDTKILMHKILSSGQTN